MALKHTLHLNFVLKEKSLDKIIENKNLSSTSFIIHIKARKRWLNNIQTLGKQSFSQNQFTTLIFNEFYLMVTNFEYVYIEVINPYYKRY